MKKIIVIGSSGAGKSVFSRKLREKTGLPLFHLDMIWHKSDRSNISREEFDMALSEIMKRDSWIIDGNYNRTMKWRLENCDTVFLLDYPVELCIQGANERVGKKRPDIPWIEDSLDESFKKWIEEFPEKELLRIYDLLKEYPEKKIYIFKNRNDAQFFLNQL